MWTPVVVVVAAVVPAVRFAVPPGVAVCHTPFEFATPVQTVASIAFRVADCVHVAVIVVPDAIPEGK
jgi:hypothetical protein